MESGIFHQIHRRLRRTSRDGLKSKVDQDGVGTDADHDERAAKDDAVNIRYRGTGDTDDQ